MIEKSKNYANLILVTRVNLSHINEIVKVLCILNFYFFEKKANDMKLEIDISKI